MGLPEDKETPANELQFTGERFVPHHTDPILALEHYHRYCFASRLVKGKKVLDIACGEGYGSAFLSKWAETVTAIDSDAAVIDHARRKYSSNTNLSFAVDCCEDLRTQGQDVFDVVVGFEMLEHIPESDQVRFLENVRRILKSEGLFVVSSPEKNEYNATLKAGNEFHKHELTLPELRALLGNYFLHVHVFAQRVLSLSAMWPLKNWQNVSFAFHARKDLLEDLKPDEPFAQPLYLIAICSNAPIPGHVISECNSFYFDTANVERMKEILQWAQHMNVELAERAQWVVQQNAEIEKDRELIQQLQRQLEERTAWAQTLDAKITSCNAQIQSYQLEFEQRTKWALSLESDVVAERSHTEKLNERLQEIETILHDTRSLVSRLETQLITASSTLAYRLLSRIGLLPKVRL